MAVVNASTTEKRKAKPTTFWLNVNVGSTYGFSADDIQLRLAQETNIISCTISRSKSEIQPYRESLRRSAYLARCFRINRATERRITRYSAATLKSVHVRSPIELSNRQLPITLNQIV